MTAERAAGEIESTSAMVRPKFCREDCVCSREFVAPICSYATPADLLENQIEDAKQSLEKLDRTYYASLAKTGPRGEHGYICGNILTYDVVQVIEAFRALLAKDSPVAGTTGGPTNEA